ncbi:MAG: RNase adapter RapZ [Erysipelotrichaceae bacterium]|nr:RNase adapter RapZ [Erysipelotrichaceae bacterium]MDD4642864.1 RNase adapter RapZ [Erysipelotrichaceae bacterium]
MSIFIITGMSGSGKSRAVNSLEDIGFYCIDNLPPNFLLTLTQFAYKTAAVKNLAIVVDARSKEMFSEFANELNRLRTSGIEYKLIFIDCDDQVLLTRYKETRRKHPLMDADNISLEEAILKERDILQKIKETADYHFDTTYLSSAQLKQAIIDVCEESATSRLQLKFVSFGYKFGLPVDADIVFDVRCLPNPFYIEELKELTGNDKAVYDYVFSFVQAQEFIKKLQDLLEFSVPLYIAEGKSQLVVAIGCTGGKHRSVSFVNYLVDHLHFDDVNMVVTHRDLAK